MRNLFSFLLCAAIPFVAQAQVKTAQAMVYFQSDKFDIAHAEIKNLDSVYFALNANEIDSIYLNANTDSKGSNAYNKKLSEKRAQSILDYLYDNITEEDDQPEVDLRSKPIRYKAYGEERPLDDNNAEKGRKRNRRVEVVFYYHMIKKEKPVVVMDTPKEDAGSGAVPCHIPPVVVEDTTIIFPNGIEVTMTKKQARANCIKVNELMTPEQISVAGITTETPSGDVLQSGGMFDVKSCDDKPFEKPIKIRMTVNPCFGEGKDSYVYKNGAWVLQKNKKGELITTRKSAQSSKRPAVIEYTVYRPMTVNCDKLISESNNATGAKKERIEKRIASIQAKNKKIVEETNKKNLELAEKLKDPVNRVKYFRDDYNSFKTRVPKGMKVDSIYFVNSCPFYRIPATAIKGKGKDKTEWALRKMRVELKDIELFVSNNQGQQFVLRNSKINIIDIRTYARPRRKPKVSRSFASEKRRTKNSYRKILVFQMSDFELKPSTVSKVTSR